MTDVVESQKVYRQNEPKGVSTSIDPFKEVVSWVKGFRSVGYVKRMLEETRKKSLFSDLDKSAKLISAHCDVAVDFIDQSFSGKTELSYLPIYYCISNLSKAIIISEGMRTDLNKNKHHGASWSGQNRKVHDISNDEVKLLGQGVIPLLYESLTGGMWSKTKSKNKNGNYVSTHVGKVKMRDIYPYIRSISHEFNEANTSTQKDNFAEIEASIDELKNGDYRIRVEITDDSLGNNRKRDIRMISNLSKDSDDVYVTDPVVASDRKEALEKLEDQFRRYLIYSKIPPRGRGVNQYTPISNSTLHLPEEIPIVLSFYHLSNVVRYDPNRLIDVFNSPFSAMLEALSRQGLYRFLVLFWSHMKRESYFIAN